MTDTTCPSAGASTSARPVGRHALGVAEEVQAEGDEGHAQPEQPGAEEDQAEECRGASADQEGSRGRMRRREHHAEALFKGHVWPVMVCSSLWDNPVPAMDTIELGGFAVAPDGALTPRGLPDPRRCASPGAGDPARPMSMPAGSGWRVDAARIPSTAERPADRPRAFAAVAGLPRNLPTGWQARLLPDHRIRIAAEAPMDCPSNVTALVAAMVRFALALDPYLDALEAEGAA